MSRPIKISRRAFKSREGKIGEQIATFSELRKEGILIEDGILQSEGPASLQIASGYAFRCLQRLPLLPLITFFSSARGQHTSFAEDSAA